MKAAYLLSIPYSLCCINPCSWNFTRCIWTAKSLSFSEKNSTTGSVQIADFSKDVIHLRIVETTVSLDHNRFVKVWKGLMDGNVVALRNPITPTELRYGRTTRPAEKEMSNVSAHSLFIKQTMWLIDRFLLKKIKDKCIAWGQLRHRNVLPLLGILNHGNRAAPTLVTPWIEYTTLASRVQSHSISDPYKIVRLNPLICTFLSQNLFIHSFMVFMTDYVIYIVVRIQ